MVTYMIPCLLGLEKLVADEVKRLGLQDVQAENGRILCHGTMADCARLNINLRCGARVMLVLGQFPARSFEELFQGVRAIPWEDYLPRDAAFPVKGYAISSRLHAVSACQSIIKKAMVERMKTAYGLEQFPETGVKHQVRFSIFKDEAAVCLDTSGEGLYKRGYRAVGVEAPLRETLAAALVTLSRYRGRDPFCDPFCGSGTIPIEAALLMTDTAPGLRRSFASEKFPFLPKEYWKEARGEAIGRIKTDVNFESYASDIDPKCVELTRENIYRAGMGKYIKAFERDALKITTGGRRGTVVCNPPYGERLLSQEECAELYKKMGSHFSALDSWQIYILSAREDFERLYGRKADKVRKLYNGMIRCGFYQYFKRKNG